MNLTPKKCINYKLRNFAQSITITVIIYPLKPTNVKPFKHINNDLSSYSSFYSSYNNEIPYPQLSINIRLDFLIIYQKQIEAFFEL